MRKRLLMVFASVLATVSTLAAAQVVNVDGGAVRGGPNNGGGFLFRGIPFAAPPLGPLRWKKPAPVLGWTSVRDAAGPAHACLQNDYGWNRSDFLTGQEDCLTLDVRTPALNGHRAVLVWIHGGSNRAGSPSDMTLSAIGKEVVVVGVRYRLGIFGFLSHRGLTEEAGASGNYGLMDQVAALAWVQRNIARFGGDPTNVTIAGESAGAQDVGLLLVAPSARPLFHKAIMESGTPGFGLPFRSLADAERIGDQLGDLLGTGAVLDSLRSTSVPALLAADKQLHDDALEADDYLWLRITVDGKQLPAALPALLAVAPAKPLIIGSNRVELDLPGGRPHRDAFLAKAFGANEGAARRFYAFEGPARPSDPRLGTRDQQLATDVTFRCPAGQMAETMATKGASVWRYEFDASTAGGMTTHAAEIPFAFGDATFGPNVSLMPYWTKFVQAGDPNAPGLAQWPRFNGTKTHVLFDSTGVTPQGPLRPEPCSLLKAL